MANKKPPKIAAVSRLGIMKTEFHVVYLDATPSARKTPASGSCSARYVSYAQPSTLISDSLDQIMKNHTLVRSDEAVTDWAICDTQVEA